MASKSAKEMTTNFTDVKVSQLNFTDFEENTRSKGQKISYPRYTSTETGSEIPLFMQLPWIDMKSYGVPKLGEYYTDDTQRAFVKVPLDQSIPEVKQLTDMLRALDEKLGSDEFKEKMFGAKSSKYIYQTIIRLPQDDEDTKKVVKKDYGPKHPYLKLKIDTSFPDGVVKSIVYNSIMEAGKRTRTKVDGIKTIDDFASHVCWMSRIRPIVRPVKLWAQAASKKDPTYGLTFKIGKTEVEPPVKSNSNVKQFMESDAFLDSDEESDSIETVKPTVFALPTSTPTSTASKGKQLAQVESDSDQESEDESEEEVVKPVTKSASKAPAKKVESDDDEESDEEEEVKPSKKATAKAVPAKASTKTKKASA